MPYRPIEDALVETYQYVDSEEEEDVDATSVTQHRDAGDDWDLDVQVLCLERCLFTFKLGCRVISAWGKACSTIHPNVHRLDLSPVKFDRLARLLCIFPRFLQSYALLYRPEWFLPPTVILKRQKPHWREEFEREKVAYAKLRSLQGVVVPICYGEVSCCSGSDWDGNAQKRPGLLIQDLGGWDLNSDDCPLIEAAVLERMLAEALSATVKHGVIPSSDGRLENIRFVGERIMFMDLELYTAVSAFESENLVNEEVRFLLQQYQKHREAVDYERKFPRAR